MVIFMILNIYLIICCDNRKNIDILGRTYTAIPLKHISSQQDFRYNLWQTWFSCSLYSFYSTQADQKSSVLEYLCWSTPAYSPFWRGVKRIVTRPVPKKDVRALPHVLRHLKLLNQVRPWSCWGSRLSTHRILQKNYKKWPWHGNDPKLPL